MSIVFRVNLAKYWECQEKCKDKGEKEECGQDGYYYFNACHRDCYGGLIQDYRLIVVEIGVDFNFCDSQGPSLVFQGRTVWRNC